MPIKRAAYKQIRSGKKKRLRNISTLSAIKTSVKNIHSLISSKNKDKLKTALQSFYSLVDKAAQKGIIHKRTSSRKKSRIAKKISEAFEKSK